MVKNILQILFLTTLSFCLSGCLKWAARAKNKLPEKTALHKTYNYKGKVIIVGAGASGLAAAKVLEQNNIDYIILEATDRYGGRLKKDTTLADFPIDIGAEWIHSNPMALNVIKGKTSADIDEELISYKLNSALSWDGKKTKPVSKSILNLNYNFMPESKFKNSTWYDFVDQNIAQNVQHRIKYNAAVNSINYSGDKVIVKTKNGNTYESDRVLVTVSIGVLKSDMITFTPTMNLKKQKAIESITFHPGFKVIMKFSEKFYPNAVNCKVKSGEKVYYDIAFKKDVRTHILGLLCTGEATENYYAFNSEQKIISSLLQELDQMFNGKATATYTGDYIIENWGQHEFTKGTWVEAPQEKKSFLKMLNQPLDNKVYFAGELNDPYKQMGVPGAILSGYYSIDKLLTEK
jgi:monoamine oxidase